MQGISILSVALIFTVLATAIPGLSTWRKALTTNWGAAALPMLALGGTMLGSTQSANLGAALSDPLRVVRVMVFAAIFLISVLQILQRSASVKLSGPGALGMIAYATLAMISAIWSIGPLISIWKGFEVFVLVLALVATSSRLRTPDDAEWLLRLFSLALLFLCMTVFAGLLLYPASAIKDPDTTYTHYYFAVRGLVPVLNPASVGSIGALLIILSLAPLMGPRSGRNQARAGLTFAAGIAATAMILAHSRTPIFACTAAIILMLLYARKWGLMIATAAIGTVVLLATSLEGLVRQYILRGQTVESFRSLTGRFGFWEQVWEQIETSPLVGHGYYAGQRLSFNTATVDNTYLEVLIGLGIMGLVVFLIPMIWTLLRLYTTRPRKGTRPNIDVVWLACSGMLAVLIIRSFTGASFQVMHPLLVIYMVVLVSTAFVVRARGHREAQPSYAGRQEQPKRSNRILKKKSLHLQSRANRPLPDRSR